MKLVADLNIPCKALHLPGQKGIRQRVGNVRPPHTNVRAIDDEKRSGSGNVFRRLGKGADLWDTLIEGETRSILNILQLKKRSKGLVPKGEGTFLLRTYDAPLPQWRSMMN